MGIGNSGSACLVFLGCPKNQVDSEHVLGSLTEAGYSLTTDPRSADLIVITTCAFLQSAVRESEAAVAEALKHKLGSTSKRVVVAGCLVERYGSLLKKKFPSVDLWVPLASMSQIPRLLASSSLVRDHRSSLIAHRSVAPRVLSTPRHFAYLKIADGCDNRCSYCMIPDIRGPFHSRPMREIIAEARDLARTGVKELILVAQDTTLYGTDFRTGVHHKDTKTRRRSAQVPQLSSAPVQESARCLGSSITANGDSNCGNLLARLLEELGEIDGIRWLRLMYTHPAHITEDIIDQFASNPKLCRYIDLPIQHVVDHLLDKMNRHYTRQDVELQLESLRAIPDMHVRTTIIVGLPGETAHDFDELLTFVRAARFDHLSCYAYSPEPGTKAARLPGQVSPAVKRERVRRLMLAQAAISRGNLKKLVGRKLTVLVDAPTENRQDRQGRQGSDTESYHQGTKTPRDCEQESGPEIAVGRTQWDAPEIDGVVNLTGRNVRPGTFVRALVIGSSTHDLTARIL